MTTAHRSLQRVRTRASRLATARSKDLAVAILVALLGAAVWIESGTWTAARNLAQDPSVLPRSLAVLLWLVAAGMVLRLAATSRGGGTTTDGAGTVSAEPASVPDGDDLDLSATELIRGGDEEDEDGDGSLPLGLLAIGGIALYAWLSFRIGWTVTSWVFLTGAVLLLSDSRVTARRVLFVAVVAAVPVLVLSFAFFELLNVRSPMTPLP